MVKVCLYCKIDYTPKFRASRGQKYCNRKCKDKAAFHRDKAAGKVRALKGGYNRTTYVKCWVKAKENDKDTAPCYLCGKRLAPEGDWVLDHMYPLSRLETRKEIMAEENLSVCCKECNIKKGTIPYDEYVLMINGE